MGKPQHSRQRSKQFRQRPKRSWVKKGKCGKLAFPTWNDAGLALAGGAGRKGSVRVYYCEICPAWHTTSQETPPLVE